MNKPLTVELKSCGKIINKDATVSLNVELTKDDIFTYVDNCTDLQLLQQLIAYVQTRINELDINLI